MLFTDMGILINPAVASQPVVLEGAEVFKVGSEEFEVEHEDKVIFTFTYNDSEKSIITDEDEMFIEMD